VRYVSYVCRTGTAKTGFWAIQVNVILCEKRRRERGKKREKEREKKKRKRREKIWIRISKNHEDIFHLVHALIHPRQYSKYEDDNNDEKKTNIHTLLCGVILACAARPAPDTRFKMRAFLRYTSEAPSRLRLTYRPFFIFTTPPFSVADLRDRNLAD